MESLYSYTSKKDDYTERGGGVPTNISSPQRQRLSPKVDYTDVVPLVPAQAVAVEYELAHRRPRPRPPATVFQDNNVGYHPKRRDDDYYGGGHDENSMDYPSPHAPGNHHMAVAPLPPPEEYFMSSSPPEGHSMTLDHDYPSYVPDQWKSSTNKANVIDGEVGDEYDRLDDMAEDMAEWAWIDHSSSRRSRSVAPAYPSERVMLASIGVLGCALAGPLITCVGLGAAYVYETATAQNKPTADAEAETTTASQSKKQAKKQGSLPMTALVGRHPAATSFEVVLMTSSMLWMSMCDTARRHRLAERSWNGMCQAGSWTWYHMRQLVLPPPPQPKPQLSAAAAVWNALRSTSSLVPTSRKSKKQPKESDVWSRTQELAVRSCSATGDLLYNHVITPSVQGIRTLTRPAPTRNDANKTVTKSPNPPLKQTTANYENATKTVINYDQSASSPPKQTVANQQITKKPVLVAAVCG